MTRAVTNATQARAAARIMHHGGSNLDPRSGPRAGVQLRWKRRGAQALMMRFRVRGPPATITRAHAHHRLTAEPRHVSLVSPECC